MILGVDYYPEHWDESRWEIDATLMQAAGITVVRMAEFAWSKMEPFEGVYDFEWLDKAIATLAGHGISVVLGTPTATPPAWLIERYRDILPIDPAGHVREWGTRLHRCMSNAQMRRYSRLITEAMAGHYRDNANVIGWQTDNEFEANECHCEACEDGFREWLRAKYGDLANLNREWGTMFWSQEYSAWSQVPVPKEARCGRGSHNPSLLLDYQQFASDTTVSFQKDQIDIMRATNAARPITHNFMGSYYKGMDYYDLASDLDFISWDNYPGGGASFDGSATGNASAHDRMRGLKQGNFWVMEERSGPVGWQTMSETTRPGEIRMWTWQAVAHGADAVVYFRWRSCLSGTEQYWHGVIGHDAAPRRRYREVSAIGKEFAALSELLDGSTVKNEIAIINSYPNAWAFSIQPQADGLGSELLPEQFHAALTKLGLGVDIVPEHADLSGYKLVIMPTMYILRPETAAALRGYVAGGGHLVTSFRTGVKNTNNVCVEMPLPGLLRDVCGVEVEEYDAIGRGRKLALAAPWGSDYSASTWCDVLNLEGARPLATYGETPGNKGFYAGLPAVTVNSFGQGLCYYVATAPDDAFCSDLLANEILPAAGLAPYAGLPGGVETATRTKDGRTLRFFINFNRDTVAIPVTPGATAWLSPGLRAGEPTCVAVATIELPAYDVALVEE